jgi:hypothetical protein
MKKEKKIVLKKHKNTDNLENIQQERDPLISSSLITIISAALISLVAGSIASLLIVPYFINPQTGSEVQVSDYNWGGAGLVIRDPKKVVVNQDLKIEESLSSISSSMIKFYPRLINSSSEPFAKKIDNNNYYLLKNPFATGLTMSVDGWVLALWPESGKDLDLKKVKNNFEALTFEGKVYQIDQVLLVEKNTDTKNIEATPILIHLGSANNLAVRNLVRSADLKIGQSVFSYDGGRGVDFGFLIDRKKIDLIRSSEDFSEELSFSFNLEPSKKPSFIFNFAGDLLAWRDISGKVFPIYSFNAKLSSLFETGRFSEPLFGVNYYNLADLKISGFNQDKGALLYSFEKKEAVASGSPAEKAGLKKGDLILEINGEAINENNDLSSIIQNYLPGQQLLVSYSRSGVNLETSLRLGEIK